MNKTELVDAVAKSADLTKVEAAAAVKAVFEEITAAVAKGDTVQLIGFGSFKPQARPAREGRNPSTGATIKIAATTLPKFAAGTAFKEAVAKGAKGCKKGKK